jgi:hypothetical protein
MDLLVVRAVLAWCSVMDIALVLLWFVGFAVAHDWMYRLHSKCFKLSVEEFDAIHYKGMATFKMGFLLLQQTRHTLPQRQDPALRTCGSADRRGPVRAVGRPTALRVVSLPVAETGEAGDHESRCTSRNLEIPLSLTAREKRSS